jgi:hypothetical protein
MRRRAGPRSRFVSFNDLGFLMIQSSVKFSGNGIAGLGLGSDAFFRKVQMQRLGEFALKTVIERTKKGIGSDDAPMPPLKQGKVLEFGGRVNGRAQFRNIGYAGWKAKHGLQPIRDLTGDGRQGGHMLDNPSVRSVSETGVRMAFTSRSARVKALANEKRSPFFSFSEADQKEILEYANQMFKAQVETIAQQIRQRKKAS